MLDKIESVEYNTVKDIVEYVPYVGKAVGLILTFYDFGKTSPIDVAIKNLRDSVAVLNEQMSVLYDRVNAIVVEVAKTQNQIRVQALQEHGLEIAEQAFRLENNPGDAKVAAEVAYAVGLRADQLLTDSNLWLWTDVQTKTKHDEDGNVVPPVIVEPMEPDFKTLPALPVYSAAISTWIAAMMVATGEDAAMIHATYGDGLRRHIAAVSVRPDWDDIQQPPQSFPEHIRARITCSPHASTKFAENGVCRYVIKCLNAIERTNKAVRDVEIRVADPGPTVLCTADPNLGLGDERSIEDEDSGIVILGVLEQMLRAVERQGTLREQFIGQFPHHEVHAPAVLYVVEQYGDLNWYRNESASQPGGSTNWQGPKKVGTGWQGFTTVFSGGGAAIYAVRPDGDLLWYGHDGCFDGNPTWRPYRKVGNGWQNFKLIFSGGEYVVYGIQNDGTLLWYRHNGAPSGGDVTTWSGSNAVASGWQSFTKVFSGGSGIIYAIRPDGVLLRVHHKGYLSGTSDWGPLTEIGTGWGGFRHVTAAAEGVIYAFTRDGRILWYRHRERPAPPPVQGGHGAGGYDPSIWEGPVEIMRGRPSFKTAFTLMNEPFRAPR